jgi:hypothetical protein
MAVPSPVPTLQSKHNRAGRRRLAAVRVIKLKTSMLRREDQLLIVPQLLKANRIPTSLSSKQFSPYQPSPSIEI